MILQVDLDVPFLECCYIRKPWDNVFVQNVLCESVGNLEFEAAEDHHIMSPEKIHLC